MLVRTMSTQTACGSTMQAEPKNTREKIKLKFTKLHNWKSYIIIN